MTVNYYNKNGRCHYATNRQKARPRGKYIGGWAANAEAARERVALYLGSRDFAWVMAETLSEASNGCKLSDD